MTMLAAKVLSETPVDIETSSVGYASRFKGVAGAWLLKAQGTRTVSMLKAWKSGSVLEVGGGHAQLTPFLLKAGFNVTVMGSDESCKERLGDSLESSSCRFETGDLYALPYEDKSFDVVIAYHLLSHLEDWKPFIQELCRVARHAVVVDYPTYRSLNGAAENLFWLKKKIEKNTRTFITYDERKIIDGFEGFGFEAGTRTGKFFLPIVIHRTLKFPLVSAALEFIFRITGFVYFFGSPVMRVFTPKEGEGTRV